MIREASGTQHGSCMVDITDIPLLNDGKVDLMPMPRARVHPSHFPCTMLLKESVSDG